MDINRNQFFLMGMVLLFLGVEFRLIDTVSLTPKCTSFLATRANYLAIAGSAADADRVKAAAPSTFHPPEWFGWALLSVASVLILHSLAMKGPG